MAATAVTGRDDQGLLLRLQFCSVQPGACTQGLGLPRAAQLLLQSGALPWDPWRQRQPRGELGAAAARCLPGEPGKAAELLGAGLSGASGSGRGDAGGGRTPLAARGKPGGGLPGAARPEGQRRRGAAVSSLCLRAFFFSSEPRSRRIA